MQCKILLSLGLLLMRARDPKLIQPQYWKGSQVSIAELTGFQLIAKLSAKRPTSMGAYIKVYTTAAGHARIPVGLVLAHGVMAEALLMLLWESSLPCMTQHRITVMMVKVAHGATVALVWRDHGCQYLPQPIICSLYCLHKTVIKT